MENAVRGPPEEGASRLAVSCLREEMRSVLRDNQPEHKPWLRWPGTFEAILDSDMQKTLREFLTSPLIHRERIREVQTKFASIAEASGVASEGHAVFLQGGTSDEWSLYSLFRGVRVRCNSTSSSVCSASCDLLSPSSAIFACFAVVTLLRAFSLADCTKCPFRQEAFFQYLLGVNEPDLLGVLILSRKEVLLFVPRISKDSLRFVGPPKSVAFYQERYGVSDVIPYERLDEVEVELKSRGVHTLHVLHGINSDSGSPAGPPNALKNFSAFRIDTAKLHGILVESRLYKSETEEKRTNSGCETRLVELHGEALFKAFVGVAGGARHVAYDCICCAGTHASILHYGHAGRPNDGLIKDGDLLLFDMGGDFSGYATDITFTFPANGVFTEMQKAIYSAVLDAQQAVLRRMKPGERWTALHRLAERVILKHLKVTTSLHSNLQPLLHQRVRDRSTQRDRRMLASPHSFSPSLFLRPSSSAVACLPFLQTGGLDTHDVGGFTASSPPSNEPGLCYLRTTRILEEGMCITVEPGCYFVEHLLKKAAADPTQASLMNLPEIQKYVHVGGVRLEDDVIVTKTGILNLTVVPRAVADVEELLRLAP
ncbi:putative prolidase [Cyclospora cayetanensis]|uniref:Xaa-Pro dipeptidase n=1 Tax=Cyclospora cayetanensis TaxID=88456 RepID=A0A1D3D7Q0_9EIME|nr:putative prolidase [Cyclospora cayetanensis]